MTNDTQRTAGERGPYVLLGVVVLLLAAGVGYFFGTFTWVQSLVTTPVAQIEGSPSKPEYWSRAGERLPITAGSADASDERPLALGKRVYEGLCASCHGAALEGQANWQVRLPNGLLPAPPHDDSGHTWHHSDATLFGVTKYGIAEFNNLDYESAMPVFKDVLSDEEIWAVLAFIKSRWSARSRSFQERVTAQEAER